MSIIQTGSFSSNSVVRLRTVMEMISSVVLYENLNEVLKAANSSQDMRIYVRKELEIWARQHYPGDMQLLEKIKIVENWSIWFGIIYLADIK